MQTNLCDSARQRAEAAEAERILRSCVHCGFCNATCPTYQELGDELDGPRGRIYLIKQFLERDEASERTRLHLDRCLSCRNCETTCPSGVEYHKLLDIGRDLLAERLPRGFRQRLLRDGLRLLAPRPGLFGALAGAAGRLRPLLPEAMLPRPALRPAPGVPLPMHTAARATTGRGRGGGAAATGLPSHRGGRRSSLLRVRRHLLADPAGAVPASARQPPGRPGKRRAGCHRHGQRRLPGPSRRGRTDPGTPLDRAARPGLARRRVKPCTASRY